MTSTEFEKFILKKRGNMYRFAFSILLHTEDARDAVQEVVLRLWKNRRSLDKAKNLESYCLNAIKNHCFDVLRKQKHRQDFQQHISRNYIEESEVGNLDMVEKLKQEIQRLPEQQRIAIELKDFQGLEYEEISEITQQSVNAIRANVSRGRKRLFEIFKEELKDA
jgi:RNA polymerase sigma-70 factor (ECF subfamily)